MSDPPRNTDGECEGEAEGKQSSATTTTKTTTTTTTEKTEEMKMKEIPMAERLQYLQAVQEIARADVEKCVETYGLNTVLNRYPFGGVKDMTHTRHTRRTTRPSLYQSTAMSSTVSSRVASRAKNIPSRAYTGTSGAHNDPVAQLLKEQRSSNTLLRKLLKQQQQQQQHRPSDAPTGINTHTVGVAAPEQQQQQQQQHRASDAPTGINFHIAGSGQQQQMSTGTGTGTGTGTTSQQVPNRAKLEESIMAIYRMAEVEREKEQEHDNNNGHHAEAKRTPSRRKNNTPKTTSPGTSSEPDLLAETTPLRDRSRTEQRKKKLVTVSTSPVISPLVASSSSVHQHAQRKASPTKQELYESSHQSNIKAQGSSLFSRMMDSSTSPLITRGGLASTGTETTPAFEAQEYDEEEQEEEEENETEANSIVSSSAGSVFSNVTEYNMHIDTVLNRVRQLDNEANRMWDHTKREVNNLLSSKRPSPAPVAESSVILLTPPKSVLTVAPPEGTHVEQHPGITSLPVTFTPDTNTVSRGAVQPRLGYSEYRNEYRQWVAAVSTPEVDPYLFVNNVANRIADELMEEAGKELAGFLDKVCDKMAMQEFT